MEPRSAPELGGGGWRGGGVSPSLTALTAHLWAPAPWGHPALVTPAVAPSERGERLPSPAAPLEIHLSPVTARWMDGGRRRRGLPRPMRMRWVGWDARGRSGISPWRWRCSPSAALSCLVWVSSSHRDGPKTEEEGAPGPRRCRGEQGRPRDIAQSDGTAIARWRASQQPDGWWKQNLLGLLLKSVT